MRKITDSWPEIKQGISLKSIVAVVSVVAAIGGVAMTIVGWYANAEAKMQTVAREAVRQHEIRRIEDSHVDVPKRCASFEALIEVKHSVDLIHRDIKLMQNELVLISHKIRRGQ